MNEAAGATATEAAVPTAGRLLREARERHGLHIAALAASIKVAPKKLELLEADRFEQLPDATFTRALAQTVCRALKIDSAPVMRLLPPPVGQRLDQVGEGLNAPFRERPGALVQRDWPAFLTSPAVWVTALFLAAALALYIVPSGFAGKSRSAAAPASAASATVSITPAVAVSTSPEPARPPVGEAPGMPPDSALPTGSVPLIATGVVSPVAVDAVASGPTSPPMSPATPVPAAAPLVIAAASAVPIVAATLPAVEPVRLLQVRSSEGSWLDVSDARGQSLVSRLLKPGETVGVDGTPPLKIRIGNANGARVVYRGQPTDLVAFTRNNVARLELK